MVATRVAEPTTVVEAQVQPEVVQVATAPVVVAPTHKTARVKGTWTQYFGTESYDFVDGKSYNLPLDLFNYLRSRGCIYDTL